METLAQDAVDALRVAYGRHDGYRAAHAKGVFCRGLFTASGAAAELTTAPHMSGAPVEAVARFSNASGRPDVADSSRDFRGLAVKLALPGGATTDLVTVNARRFYSRTPEDFVAFTHATAGGLAPLKLARFLVRHRETLGPLLDAARARPPESYATAGYNSLHSFRWVDRDGRRRALRYRWSPPAGEAYVPVREARRRGRDYLRDELAERLARGPVALALELVLAADGDPLDDASRAWPDGRETVAAGTLELTELAGDLEAGGDPLVFDPTRVADGIELSDDPILRFRPRAYAVSAEARSSHQPPSVVSGLPTGSSG